MSEAQTVDTTLSNKVPTVEQFTAKVIQQLNSWSQANVEGLCSSQTETVIEGLAPYYHTAGEDIVPSVETFKEVIRDFQAQKERPIFADLTEPEVNELIAALAPHFRASAPKADEGNAEASTDGASSLDRHPF